MNNLRGKFLNVEDNYIYPNERFARLYQTFTEEEREDIELMFSRFTDGKDVVSLTLGEAINLDEAIAEKIQKFKGEKLND